MDNPQATREELAWLAGIVDGEGYIGLRLEQNAKGNRWMKAEVHITNTDIGLMEKVVFVTRKMGLNPHLRISKNKGNCKDAIIFGMKNFSKVKRFLEPLLPYLSGDKKKKAALVHEFCSLRLDNPYRPQVDGWKTSHRAQNSNHGWRRPYSEREIELVELCQPLMKRGASETTRVARRGRYEKAVEDLRRNGGRFSRREDMVQTQSESLR